MFGASWVTSVFGAGSLGGAAFTVLMSLYNRQMPDPATVGVLISAVASGVGLLAAKDKNVTGGTVSAVTGAKLNQPISVVDEKLGGRR